MDHHSFLRARVILVYLFLTRACNISVSLSSQLQLIFITLLHQFMVVGVRGVLLSECTTTLMHVYQSITGLFLLLLAVFFMMEGVPFYKTRSN
jgi:Na+/H+-dicarboxylate symporter